MPRYTAVLDACVLVPIALADTLLRVAEKGLYRPLWSDRILAEAQAATEEIHPGMDAGKRFAQMREAFDDALVGHPRLLRHPPRSPLSLEPLPRPSGTALRGFQPGRQPGTAADAGHMQPQLIPHVNPESAPDPVRGRPWKADGYTDRPKARTPLYVRGPRNTGLYSDPS
jgi:hypothetical protein